MGTHVTGFSALNGFAIRSPGAPNLELKTRALESVNVRRSIVPRQQI